MQNPEIARKVISFQYSCMHSGEVVKRTPINNKSKYENRFQNWNLPKLMRQLQLNYQNATVLWVGYGYECFLQAFAYCLLQKCNASSSSNFITTKYYIYQLAKNYASPKQQKELVQNICYLQYTEKVSKFINKDPAIQMLIARIFERFIQQKKLITTPLQQLKAFALHFPFASFEVISPSVGKLISHLHAFYIVEEKKCIFIIDVKDKESKSNRQNPKTKVKKMFSFAQASSQHESSNNSKHNTPQFIVNGNSKKASISHSENRMDLKINIQPFHQQNQIKYSQEMVAKIYQKRNKNGTVRKDKSKQMKIFNNKSVENLRSTIEKHIEILNSLKIRAEKTKEKRKSIYFPKKRNKSEESNHKIHLHSNHAHPNYTKREIKTENIISHRLNSNQQTPTARSKQDIRYSINTLSAKQHKISFTYLSR